MEKEIEELVEFAINSKNTINKKVEINIIDKIEANLLKLKTGFDLFGYKRIIDRSSIKHTIKEHGNINTEFKRGQIAVTEKDFKLVPQIVKSENVIYSGKSKAGIDCVLYEIIIENTYYYVEEIRTGKKELCLKSMYKRKPTIIK
ncbi:hypothetical protein [Flavobacterium psychrophilum]|uniref:PBECR3 domain-containing polyvalent protein n=1 Tax=Flavobacterium psychrophilum TaxID=96345 RepID=UPI001D0971FF|nr:hypothetical protein [Flavobacterium psychrophilum]MCB6088033.1 hypothetical protein [Flavobacterium psychrophilum]MEB3378528.1 hypothetical protein [Flavobacterium psychrophilum]